MAKRKNREEEEEVVMVGPGAESDEDDEDQDDQSSQNEEGDDEGEDEDSDSSKRKKKDAKNEDDEDGDSDEEDDRVGHGEDDEEDDEDGNSKRNARKARKERQKRARERNQVEINFLRQQNEQLEKKLRDVDARTTRTEVGAIDQRINSIQGQLKVANQVLAKAIEDGAGEDVVEATEIRDKLRDSLGKLTNYKTEVTRRAQESEEEPEVDSRLVYHAKQWMDRNTWYNPQGADRDSRIVAAIDDRLVQEGYDPRNGDYWNELTRRVQKRLPHKFKNRRDELDDDLDDEDEEPETRRNRRGGGPRFSTGGRERPLRKNEVYIDPDRKQAMVDAGVWDDPVLRKRYLKRYQQWDRENPRGQRR